MNAIVITQPGPPGVLKSQKREKPTPARDEVLIQVRAAGVNRPDTFQRKGNYPAPSGIAQDIPGLEVAGIVEACGNEVSRWKEGDTVCALLGGGGYAQYVVACQHHCLPLPIGWSFQEAASLPETVFTVWHNVFQRGALKRGEHLLVHGGSSGIGITAIQLAKALGAEVSVTAGTDEKCEACKDLGADRAINYKNEDFEKVLSNGVDVVLEMVGGDYIAKDLRILKDDGRLVFINAMKGPKAEWNALDIMRRRLTITGSTLRARDKGFKAALTEAVFENVWPVINSGMFRPVIFKTFPLEEASQAHELMESGVHIGKIVLVNE